jgi:hypothetical protein
MRRYPIADRFWAKVDKSGDCWEWTAGKNQYGYGTFGADNVRWLAHRWAYTHLVAPIPEGMQVDHLCRNRACVNPAHMELVTSGENTRRGLAGQHVREWAEQRTHCPHGHAYDEANTRWVNEGPKNKPRRQCRECDRIRSIAKRKRAKALREGRSDG